MRENRAVEQPLLAIWPLAQFFIHVLRVPGREQWIALIVENCHTPAKLFELPAGGKLLKRCGFNQQILMLLELQGSDKVEVKVLLGLR